MKLRYSLIVSVLFIGLGLGIVGCSGGGGGGSSTSTTNGGTTPSTAPAAVTSVSGLTSSAANGGTTTGSSALSSRGVAKTTEGIATLILDANDNGLFDDSADIKYTAPVVDGKFSFEDVAVDANASVVRKALLSVAIEGYAPYHQTLDLTQGNAVSVLAKIEKPVLTEVIDLSSLSTSARESSFVQFGTKKDGSGLQSFSKLVSMSEFRAMADVNLTGDGVQSNSIIPVGAFPSSVKKVTVDMQSFNSSDPDDFAAFPGRLSGHGKSTSRATASEEVPLESAGFDLLKLTDQDGEHIDLQPVATSKLSALAGREVCGGMLWTRYLYSDEVAIIKNWGDDDNDSSNGYQVPIWSNDNATWSWQYVALATVQNLNGSRPYFTVCVDKKWQGYLNCDSPLSTSRPQQVCVDVKDQNGKAMSGFSVSARKGGSYDYTYIRNGQGLLEIKDANKTGWKFSYSNELTGWRTITLDDTVLTVDSTNSDCDYDLNITLENPYTTQLHVKAFAIDDENFTTPLTYAYVYVSNSDAGDYYNKYAHTDENGTATFDVKPNVEYTVTYKAGTAKMTANGVLTTTGTPPNVVGKEISDTTREVTLYVKNQNIKPNVYVYVSGYNISDATDTMNFSASASDKNYDSLTFNGLTLSNPGASISAKPLVEGVDYTVSYRSSYDGYYYISGKLNLQSSTLKGLGTALAARDSDYVLSAEFTDGVLSEKDSDTFDVSKNTAPRISSLYLTDVNTSYRYYSYSSSIPKGTFTLNAYAYDRDGDSYTLSYSINGNNEGNGTTPVALDGDYNITVTAIDKNNNSSSKSFTVHTGNHVPEISSFGTTNSFVNPDKTFKLYAYVYDSDYDSLTVKATAVNGKEYNLTKIYSYYYKSADINISDVVDANKTAVFSIYAFDGEDNSSSVSVTVLQNKTPLVDLNSTATDLNTSTPLVLDQFTDTTLNFTCNASDPEGTYLYYNWYIDGSYAYGYLSTFTKTFTSEGNHTITCEVTDRDGASASDDMNVSITRNDPPVFDTPLADMSVYQGTTQTLTCLAHDPEARGSVSYAWTFNGKTQPDEDNQTSVDFTFTKLGVNYVSCIATDADGMSATSSAVVTVSMNNPPVITTGLSDVTLDVNETHDFNCAATDPEGTTVAYTWLLDGTVLADTTSTVTKSFPATGTHTISCTVADADGQTATSSAGIVVKASNKPPVVGYDYFANVNGDSSVRGTITFSDPDGTATIAVDGTAPIGFTIDPNSGAYTYDASQQYAKLSKGLQKNVEIPLIVTDNNGATANTMLIIYVQGTYEDGSTSGDTNAINSSPLVGVWVLPGSTPPYDILLVIVDNNHYFFTQEALGANGVLGGVEVGAFTLNTAKTEATNFTPMVNTNGDDSAEGITLTYNSTNDTANVVDSEGDEFVLERVPSGAIDTSNLEKGGWVSFDPKTGELIAIVMNGSRYMEADVNALDNSFGSDPYGRDNAAEFGSYTISGNSFTPTVDPEPTNLNVTCDDSNSTGGCGTLAGDSNGVYGLSSLMGDLNVTFVDDNHMKIVFTESDGSYGEKCFVRIIQNGPVALDENGTSCGTSDVNLTGIAANFADKTVYSTIENIMGTMESWTFSSDFKTVTVKELEGGSSTGDETLNIVDYNTTSFTVADPDGRTVIELVGTPSSDYVLVSIAGGDAQRVYFDEAKARAYFLSSELAITAADIDDKMFVVVQEDVYNYYSWYADDFETREFNSTDNSYNVGDDQYWHKLHDYTIIDGKLNLSDEDDNITATRIDSNGSGALFTFKTLYNSEHEGKLSLFGTSFEDQVKAVTYHYTSKYGYVKYDINVSSLIGKDFVIHTGDYPDSVTIDSLTQLTYKVSSGDVVFKANYEVIDGNVIKITSYIEKTDVCNPAGFVFAFDGSSSEYEVYRLYNITMGGCVSAIDNHYGYLPDGRNDVNDTSSGTATTVSVSSDDTTKVAVSALMPPTATADVNDAKNLFAQLREASESFIDLENDMNESTIVGTQYKALVDNIQPKLNDVASDLNSSVTSFNSCLGSFAATLESDFNTSLDALGERLYAIAVVIDIHDDNVSWEDTTIQNDTVKHTYSKSGTTVTEVYSINDMNVTAVYDEDDNVTALNADGLIRLNGTGYDVNITSLSFNGVNADFNMTAHIEGDTTTESMDLNQLAVSFVADSTQNNSFAFFTNAKVTLDGTIVANDRTLVGRLTLDDNDQTNNKLVGSMTCATEEPSFTGEIVLNMPLSALKAIAQDDDLTLKGDYWSNHEFLMATFSDGTTSLVTNAITSWSNDSDVNIYYTNYTMHTQSDRNITCTAYDEYNSTTLTQIHHFGCDDGVTLTPYNGNSKVVSVTSGSDVYYLEDIWWDYEWNDDGEYETESLRFYVENEGEAYFDDAAQKFMLNGNEFVVNSISVREPVTYEDYNFDLSLLGTLTDGAKVITAKVGVNNVLSPVQTQIYAKDLNVTDGTNEVSAAQIAVGMSPADMKSMVEDKDDSGYHPHEGGTYSQFESYSYTYTYGEQKSDKGDNSQKITTVSVDKLHLNVTDANSNILLVDANITYAIGDVNRTMNFDGSYSYKETTFLGHIDGEGNENDGNTSLLAHVNGSVTASGYEPFGIESVVALESCDDCNISNIDAYVLFTRGDPEYKLGIWVNGNLDATTTVQIADNNGVMATYTDVEDATTAFSATLTDKDGTSLATVGEVTTGNGWEIQYSDGSSETIY